MAKVSYSIMLLLDADLRLVQEIGSQSGDALHDWYLTVVKLTTPVVLITS